MNKTFLPEQIDGLRITLKRHHQNLATEMFSCIDQDRQRLRKFLPWVDSTQSFKDSLGYIKLTEQWWSEGSMFDFGIYDKSSSAYMGNFGVHNIAWEHNRCELGYWISKKFEGHGYVSEAAACLERILFDLGFNRIEIRCSSNNSKSANLPNKNGYQLEGVLKQDCIEHGEYRDTLVFAKLKSEFVGIA